VGSAAGEQELGDGLQTVTCMSRNDMQVFKHVNNLTCRCLHLSLVVFQQGLQQSMKRPCVRVMLLMQHRVHNNNCCAHCTCTGGCAVVLARTGAVRRHAQQCCQQR
jgi:hypothetical protein